MFIKILTKPYKKIKTILQEEIFDLNLIKQSQIHTLPEKIYLKRFFATYKIDCIFDVGANNGQYASMLRKYAGYRGRIISFEPIPAAAEKIRSLSINDPLWTVEQIALDESEGTAEFKIMVSDQFSSLGTPAHKENDSYIEFNKPAETITVKKETLEEVYTRLHSKYKFQKPFLKMDTQGFDVRIAKGGKNVISQFLGLQSELAVQKLYEESVDFRDAITFYESLGFTLGSLVPNNAGHFPDMVEIDCIMVNDMAIKSIKK